VFDDQPEVADLACMRLEQMYFRTRRVSTIDSFLAALLDFHPNLVLLDLSLGETDAVEVLGMLRDVGFAGDVILMSGHAGSILDHTLRIGEGLGLTMAGAIRKPFRAAEFGAAVDNIGRPSRNDASSKVQPSLEPNLLRLALSENWIEFWFQPKVELATGLTVGAEALARLRHPRKGIMHPASFLPGASDDDMMLLTLRALNVAFDAAETMRSAGRKMAFAVNVAGRLLLRPQLINQIAAIRRQHTKDIELVLELTETDVLEDREVARAFATQAILNGCQISIDDFGHGYATFDRLRDLPFNELKLDRSIVSGCASDAGARALCKAGTEIARGFNATIVAEGVETLTDLDAVRSLGFDAAQGYLFSPPVPMAAFRNLPFDRLW